jgi:tripartite-type tricarboxylate transporter receptor subunit TctC
MNAIGIVAALSALLTGGNAFAQASYPDKPRRILVGFVAGGPADVVARMVGDKLTEVWGKPVVIENVTGAGGNMATERVAKAAPDGYTPEPIIAKLHREAVRILALPDVRKRFDELGMVPMGTSPAHFAAAMAAEASLWAKVIKASGAKLVD